MVKTDDKFYQYNFRYQDKQEKKSDVICEPGQERDTRSFYSYSKQVLFARNLGLYYEE